MIEQLQDLSLPIEKLLDELMDGDIIVFQREDDGYHALEFPTLPHTGANARLVMLGIDVNPRNRLK